MSNRKWLGAICLSSAASIWGGMYVVSKFVLEYVPPMTLVWLRYVIAFIVLFFILKIVERKKHTVRMSKRNWRWIGLIGFIGYFLSIAFQFIGTKLSDAHTGALITSATPAFISVFAYVILKETFTIRKGMALLLATIGVITIIGFDMDFSSSLLGSLILVGAAITWALLSVYVKVATETMSSLTITTYAIFVALLLTTPFMLWEVQYTPMDFHHPYVLLGVLYLGTISTAGAFFLWNKGMELMDAGIGALFFYFQPIVGAFFGWLLLNETINSSYFLGGFLILAGVVLVTIQGKFIVNEQNVIQTKAER